MSESIFEISPSVTLVTSFDFDGCSDRDFSQEALINHIADESKKIQGLKKIIVMIGSLRQSLKLDILNAGHNSAYPNYISCSSLMDNLLPKLREVIDESIEVTFDTYLQFDSFQQLPPGTTFNYMRKIFLEMDQLYILDYCRSQQTIEEDSSVQFLESASFDNKSGINLLTAKHLADCSKISIIYSQIHHIASQFPQDQIIMHFYDDKENILENLYQFYSQNPIWIPNDFKLCLFQQKALEGNVPSSIGKTNFLTGEGPINHQYHTQLKTLAEKCNWTAIPEGFKRFENDFQASFGVPKVSEQSPVIQKFSENTQYSGKKDTIESHYQQAIQLPQLFYSDKDKTSFQNNALKQARMVYRELIAIEKSLWGDYINAQELDEETLEIYKLCNQLRTLESSLINQSRNFPTHIAIEKIKSTDSEIRSIKTILKNKYKLTRQDIIECKEEAKLYYSNLNTHHKRLAYQETYYEKYIKHLGDNISSIPVQFIKPTAVKPSAGLFFFDNIEGEMSSVDTHENGSRMLTPKPIEPQHGSDSLISTVDTHAGEYSLFGPNSISFFDAIAKVIAMPEAQENGSNIVTPQPISPLNGSSFLNEA